MTAPTPDFVPVKSCINCPSFVSAEDSQVYFNKSIGLPVCARFGKPLAKIGSTEEQKKVIQKQVAKNCSKFGEERPQIPNWDTAKFNVAVAMPVTSPQHQQELVTGCQMCEFFIRDDLVLEGAGFGAGLCAAKGNLLLNTRHTYYARNCEDRSLGSAPDDALSNMYFLPEYSDDFMGAATPEVVRKRNSKHLVDPATYETDAEVSPEDAERGIRAWREIEDQAGERTVMLPIYNADFFDPEFAELIPQIGDDEHPEDYIDHFGGTYKLGVLWMQLRETPALWGEAGSGKTELFRHLAWMMQLPFFRFSITGSTELDDLAGKMHFENGQTLFKYGRLPTAWNKPSVIVLDEPNTGPPEVWQFLRPLTDNSKQLVLDMNEGERISKHQDCYLGMAMNPAWDMRNVGANQIGDADANRMMHLALDLPPESTEREIIKARCAHDGWEIPEKDLTMVMRIAEDLRKLCEDQALTMSWAIRPQIKVARALRWFDPITAYKMASADYLDVEQSKMVLQTVRSHVDYTDTKF